MGIFGGSDFRQTGRGWQIGRIRNGLKKLGWTIRWSKRVGAITQARQKAWRFSFEAGDRESERHPRRPARTIEDFSWSFRSRRLAFMCILCIYYGWLPGTERQNRRSSGLLLGPRSSFHVPSPLPPFDSLIDTVMLVPPIMVVQLPLTKRRFSNTIQRPGNPAKPNSRRKNKLIGGKLARKFSSPRRVNFIPFNYLIFLGIEY